MSLTTMAYTPNYTKCGESGNGEFPEIIMKSKVSWTSTIPGIVHARHNGMHYSVIRIGTE